MKTLINAPQFFFLGSGKADKLRLEVKRFLWYTWVSNPNVAERGKKVKHV